MKTIIFIQLILLFQFNAFSQKANSLKELNNFGNNPGNLKMFFYGSQLKTSKTVPLVVVLHGCGQNAQDAANLTGWNKLADLYNFVVLYPQQKLLNNPNLCFNWFNSADVDKNKGECESIYQMIKFVQKQYAIDTTAIFVTGLSAGAAMSVVMTATHPELFKAAAVFAGGAYKLAANPLESVKVMLGNKSLSSKELADNVKNQNKNYTGKYPMMIIYQGKNDPIVNFKNGKYLMEQWTALNNTDTIPEKTEYAFTHVKDITRREYHDTLGAISVLFYEVNNLGHQLLIQPGTKNNQGGKLGLFGVNKGFHSTYQTAIEFGLLEKK